MNEWTKGFGCTLVLAGATAIGGAAASVLAGATAIGGAAASVLAGATLMPADETADKALPDAKTILEKSIEAMGGQETFDSIESSHVVISIDAPMGAITMTARAARPDKVFIEQSMPGMGEMTMGLNGDVAWMQSGRTGYQVLPPAQAEAMRRQANMHNIVSTFSDQYSSIETVEKVDRDGTACYKLKMVDEDGDESFAYFGSDDYLLVAMEATDTTQMGKQTTTMAFSDWAEQDKIRFYQTVDVEQQGMQMTMKISKVEFNKVDPSVFELPEEVKKLTGGSDSDDSESVPEPGN